MGDEGLYISVLVIFSILLIAPAATGMQSAFADGNGSPAECETDLNLDSDDSGQSGDEISTILTGEVVTGVCIKSGKGSFTGDENGDDDGVNCNGKSCKGQHSVKFTEDGFYGNDGCYEVTGLGTIEVTITTTRDDKTCKDLSHVDVMSEPGECLTDDQCSDNDVCTGAETCEPQTLSCQAGTPLTCDDGLFCNGAETCDATNGCEAGTAPDCDDGVSCTIDTCNETTDTCDNAPDDNVCNDNDVCTGAETCDATNGCEAGTPLTCDDADVCNGAETCNATNGCEAGTPPVPLPPICEPQPPLECVEHVIDFESLNNLECSQIVDESISIGGTSVLLQVGNPGYTSITGGHPSSPNPGILVSAVPHTDGQTVTVGNPAESFRSNGVGDQPEPDNPETNMCFFSDTTTFVGSDPNRGGSNSFYYLTFSGPITSLSLDLYDYADDTVYGGAFFNSCNGGTDACNIGAVATLTAFENDDFTNPVGTATFEVDASYEDGQIANLSIPSAQGVTFLSATLTLSAPDIGTGIDNITFCEDTALPPAECEPDSIEIVNHSFEDPVLNDGDFIGSPHNNEPPGVPGWKLVASPSGITVFNPTSDPDTSDFYQNGNFEPDYNGAAEALITGQNVAVTHDGKFICQDLTATLQADTEYTLEVDVGWRNDNANLPNYLIHFRTLDGNVQNTFASLAGGESSFGGNNDNWITETITHQTGSNPVGEGLPLRICLIAIANGGPYQVNFDNVRLSTGVDECPVPPADLCENVVCDDGNVCTTDACNAENGLCSNTAVEDGSTGATTCGLGVCENTVNSCEGGETQVCDPFVGASTEICDGLDNNCDGSVDEGLDCSAPPTEECIDCSKPTEFTVSYDGPNGLTFDIVKLDKDGITVKEIKFVGGTVNDGESITIDSINFIKPKNTVEANTAYVFSNGDIVEIHTSCSKPLYEGLSVTSGAITLTVESGLVTHVKGADKGTFDELDEPIDAIPPTLACYDTWKANK